MKDPNIQLWAEDEVHFQRHTTLTRMWALKGQQPRAVSASTRQQIGFFGAINLKTGSLLTQKASVFNADTFWAFLQHILCHTQGKIFLIFDNATWHKAQALKSFFVRHQQRLIRIFLPPYSPELNPIERVWRITRRRIPHNRYFQFIEDLRIALTAQFLKWEQPNDAL